MTQLNAENAFRREYLQPRTTGSSAGVGGTAMRPVQAVKRPVEAKVARGEEKELEQEKVLAKGLAQVVVAQAMIGKGNQGIQDFAVDFVVDATTGKVTAS